MYNTQLQQAAYNAQHTTTTDYNAQLQQAAYNVQLQQAAYSAQHTTTTDYNVQVHNSRSQSACRTWEPPGSTSPQPSRGPSASRSLGPWHRQTVILRLPLTQQQQANDWRNKQQRMRRGHSVNEDRTQHRHLLDRNFLKALLILMQMIHKQRRNRPKENRHYGKWRCNSPSFSFNMSCFISCHLQVGLFFFFYLSSASVSVCNCFT